MHLTPKVGLHALVLLAAVLGTQVAEAGSPRPNRHAAPNHVVFQETFHGFGATRRDAEDHALRQACEALGGWLATHGGAGWVPTPEYLRVRQLARFGEPTPQELPKSGHVQEISMQLEVTQAQAAEMQHFARQQRMNQRHWLVARVLAGVVALVLVCGGYLRLEEATRGYYTMLLRAAALVVLAGVGAGLWLFT
jgi:hypothetical protein